MKEEKRFVALLIKTTGDKIKYIVTVPDFPGIVISGNRIDALVDRTARKVKERLQKEESSIVPTPISDVKYNEETQCPFYLDVGV